MTSPKNNINRREFIKNATSAGLASILASTPVFAQTDPNSNDQTPKLPQVPKRKLGKTGVEVPMLNLGGIFDTPNNQIVLRKAIDWGVTYWDTAYGYLNGNSETGMGIYLKKNPKIRKKMFIVSKASGARTVTDMDNRLKTSLERLQTDYIDLYYIHGLSDPKRLTDDVKQWAQEQKKQKRIKFFGFSTHKNMPQCIAAAAKLGWVDAIMTTYNFRVMQDEKMQAALEDAHKAGIGLIAMKTQGGGQIQPDSQADQKIAGHFLKQGYTEFQAKIKAVWNDNRIASICSQMPNLAILNANVAAALDKTKLSQDDMDQFKQYAQKTCSGYCTSCAHICQAATPENPYISEVMRYLMYHNSYGDPQRARQSFAQLPAHIRTHMTHFDYTAAEAKCPQHLPIAKLIAQAAQKLT